MQYASIEWYDFFLYGTAAALVFPDMFFPSIEPFVGVLASFTTQFVGFAARPIGAAIFGHFGDRIGRKATLITTLLLMGIGDVPDRLPARVRHDRRARADPAGGAENRAGHRRGRRVGRLGSAVDGVGSARAARPDGQHAPAGCPHRTVAVHGRRQAAGRASGEGFDSWGWRVPFLLSVVLVGIGLYMRLRVLESPEFAAVTQGRSRGRPSGPGGRAPLPQADPAAAFVRMSEQAPFYLFITFVLTYGTKQVGLDRDNLLSPAP